MDKVLLNLFEQYERANEQEKLKLIEPLSLALKNLFINCLSEIDNIKIKDVVYLTKQKSIIIKYYIDKDFLYKDSFIVIKYSQQKSKKIVPSQVIKYLSKISKNIEKYFKQKYPYDLTVFLIGPEFSSGTAWMPRSIPSLFNENNVGDFKYYYLIRSRDILLAVESFLNYVKARISGLVEKTRHYVNKDKAKEAVKILIKIYYMLKKAIRDVKELKEIDFIEIVNELYEDEDIELLDLFV